MSTPTGAPGVWKRIKKVYSKRRIIDYLSDTSITIKLNAESYFTVSYKERRYTQRELTYTMGITGYPTTVFLDADGTPITELPGYVPADA